MTVRSSPRWIHGAAWRAGSDPYRVLVPIFRTFAVPGANADTIKSAALAAVPGTVKKTEQRADGTYEAEITKADGTEVHVSLGQDFAGTSTRTRGAQGGDIGK